MDGKNKTADHKVNFTYQMITADNSTQSWEHRFDHYLQTGDIYRHSEGIIINLAIIAGLIFALMFLLKTGINADFEHWIKNRISRQQKRQTKAQVNQIEEEENNLKTGKRTKTVENALWKRVNQDVLRPPRHPALLACFIGSGV